MIFISLAGDPVAKTRARVVRGKSGKVWSFTPKKSAGFNDRLRAEAIHEMKGKKPLEGALSVTVCAYMPIPKSLKKKVKACDFHTKKPDLDNIIKQLDALNGVVYKDDSQVALLTATKIYSIEPRLTIQVSRC